MKIFWVSLFIILLFFVSAVYFNYTLKVSSQEIMNIFEDIEKNIGEKNWELAQRNFTTLQNKWEDISNPWKAFIEHQELDNIQLSLIKMGEYIKVENEDLAKAELASLKFLIGHIYSNNTVNIENIF